MELTEHITIQRPLHETAKYMFDPTNDTKWIEGVTKVKLLTPEPVGKGTRIDRTTKIEGKSIEYIIQVHQLTPDHLMVMEAVAEDAFPKKISYKLSTAKDDATLVTIVVGGELKGVGSFFLKPLVQKNIRDDLKHLQKILEAK